MSSSEHASSAKLEPVDLQRLRHLLGVLLAGVGVTGLFAVDSLDRLWAACAFAGVGLTLVFPKNFAARGDRFWSRVGYAVFAYAVTDLLLVFLTNRQELIASIVRVTMAITVLRCAQPRRRRDDMQLILLSLFLAATGGALSLSPVFAVQVFLFIPVAGAVLFLINLLEDTPEAVPPDGRWAEFAWGEFAGRVRAALDWRTGAFFAGAVGVVVVSGALIFAALPRFRMDNAVPFLELPGKGRTGVSDRVSVGAAGEVTQDETKVLRADTPGRARPAVNPYWRLHVMDDYISGETESSFAASPSAETLYETVGRAAEVLPVGTRPSARRSLYPKGEWVVHLEGGVSRQVPLPGVLSRLRFDKPQDWRQSATLRLLKLDRAPSASLHMQVSAEADLDDYPAAPPELRVLRAEVGVTAHRYPGTLLELPDDDLSRSALREAVGRFGGEGVSLGEFTTRASAWLASRHAYALRDGYAVRRAPAGEPKDYLVRWMRSGGTGWCEHFASSFVLLARAAGHPARLVTGFSGGEWNESDNYLLVRMKHAHAWCEVYDRPAGVWRRIDPTPAGGAGGGDGMVSEARQGIRGFSGLAAWYDGVTMYWFRNVVNFEESDQRRAVKAALDKVTSWRERAEALAKSWREALAATWDRWRHAPREAAPWLGGALAVALLVRVVVLAWRRWRGFRLARAGEDDPVVRLYRRKAGAWLRRFDAAAQRGRMAPDAVRGPLEHLRYGRPAEWRDADAVLKSAARWWRARR